MQNTSYIELSQSALFNNLIFIKSLLGKTNFTAVVKGNAYGHGIAPFCGMLYNEGVRHYSVFSANEALEVKSSLPDDIVIVIMGYIPETLMEWVIDNQIEFFVFEKQRLESVIHLAKKIQKKANIHIEMETGMNRTGFDLRQSVTLFTFIKENIDWINVKGVCSHLAGAENIANYKRISDQQHRFSRLRRRLNKESWLKTNYHLACSAATIQYPKTRLDLARIGILLYGFFPSQEVLVQYLTKNRSHENPLKRVISWKTVVMDVKMVRQGEFVGYGTSFFTNSPTKIALIPVGYAHGFSRSLSNQGKVIIRGQLLEVIGTVNMNMLAIDITKATGVETGDEVVLIGQQGNSEISVSSFSNMSDQVNYELLTRLPQNINRKIIK